MNSRASSRVSFGIWKRQVKRVLITDSTTCEEFNTESAEYQAVIRDIDIVAGYLKTLSDKGVPVLWRPLHEASGKWFWWGYKGSKACRALYHLLYNRLTVTHELHNLIWVWTTDEAADALDWYPGDEYVDIVGRDYYYYPREANHGSLVASFEKVKEIFEGKKIVALSENGSIPHPDSLVSDGAGWSFFMPWYGDYTMDGWAHDNTAADWNYVMNHDYVLTLDEMPGWDSYTVPVKTSFTHAGGSTVSIRTMHNYLLLSIKGTSAETVELYKLNGAKATVLGQGLAEGIHHLHLGGIPRGTYLVKVHQANGEHSTSARIILK